MVFSISTTAVIGAVSRKRASTRTVHDGFTLAELLVVVTTIAILASLLLPALSKAKATTKRASCTSNLRQVGLAIRMYADDHRDSSPSLPQPNPFGGKVQVFYKELV